MQLPFQTESEWQRVLSQSKAGFYSFVAEIEDRLVGHCAIEHNQRPRLAHIATFGIAVHDDHQGLGVGSQLIKSAVELMDNWLQVKRIQIEVMVDNQPAIALYEKFGFTIEGQAQSSVFRQGEYVDTYYMARIV